MTTVYRYWSTLRPVFLGTYPKNDNLIGIHNFDERIDLGDGLRAWGYIDYSKPLDEDLAYRYDLVPRQQGQGLDVTQPDNEEPVR